MNEIKNKPKISNEDIGKPTKYFDKWLRRIHVGDIIVYGKGIEEFKDENLFYSWSGWVVPNGETLYIANEDNCVFCDHGFLNKGINFSWKIIGNIRDNPEIVNKIEEHYKSIEATGKYMMMQDCVLY